MDRVLRHSWFRSAGSLWIAVPALILLLGIGGYLLTSSTIRADRDAEASRRAQVETVQTQEVLGRARAYIEGLGSVLASEPRPEETRFARLAGGMAASVGLNDVLWTERLSRSERKRYERRLGTPIRRLTPSGRFEHAPVAGSYLPATFTTATRPELRRGVDVSGFPGLAAAIGNRATVFAAGASGPGSLGAEPGFYLLEAARFGRGPGSRGFLVAFVPRGWFATTLGGDPRRVAISQDGRHIEGELNSPDAAASFEALGHSWRIDVAREPPTGLQSTLPWLALAWPFAAALIVFGVLRAVMLRRRAEREAQEIFERSLDMLASASFDGYFRRVNPAFMQTLGYSEEELQSKPYTDFLLPEDVEPSHEVFAEIIQGRELVGFENRFVCADGSVRWIQWTVRPDLDEQIMYGIGRDVTDSRRLEREFEEVFNLSPDLLCIAGFDGYLKRVNPAFEQAFGYSSAELLSRPVFEFGHPEDVSAARDAFSRLTRGEAIPRFENRNIRADGSTLWLEWSTRALPEEGIIYAAARDVTERMRGDAELRAAQQSVEASRAELAVYADEQAALRRVATLVARGVPGTEIFSAVAEELRGFMGADAAAVARLEPDGSALVIVGFAGEGPRRTRWELDDSPDIARVFRTGISARFDAEDAGDAPEPIADAAIRMGLRSSVASPIVVEGRIWGTVAVSASGEPLASDAEARVESFAELVATAIANAENRAELKASRARVVTASAEERSRVVRDLHDGAQQRLVHTVISLKLAARALGSGDGHVEELVGEALDHAEQANSELRELVHGILPGVLTSGGLRAGVEDLASRSSLPVTMDVSAERFPPAVEATAYFVVSEALTNAVKHARALGARVSTHVEDSVLQVEVSDNGVGGADPDRGSGLTGLRDRVEAIGGKFEITSPAGGGTSVAARIPISS